LEAPEVAIELNRIINARVELIQMILGIMKTRVIQMTLEQLMVKLAPA
jgi:hypothetical protein